MSKIQIGRQNYKIHTLNSPVVLSTIESILGKLWPPPANIRSIPVNGVTSVVVDTQINIQIYFYAVIINIKQTMIMLVKKNRAFLKTKLLKFSNSLNLRSSVKTSYSNWISSYESLNFCSTLNVISCKLKKLFLLTLVILYRWHNSGGSTHEICIILVNWPRKI